jgi:hypothetical protein
MMRMAAGPYSKSGDAQEKVMKHIKKPEDTGKGSKKKTKKKPLEAAGGLSRRELNPGLERDKLAY